MNLDALSKNPYGAMQHEAHERLSPLSSKYAPHVCKQSIERNG